MKDNNFKDFLMGKKLYGDDFNDKEIKEWFKDEKEGYSGLIFPRYHKYGDHAINIYHGYRKLKKIKKFSNVLGFGSALGDDLLPIINKADKITIVEPSSELISKDIGGKKVKYISPKPNGKLDFNDNTFDLIVCFGVLHHIPNVSAIIKELTRVLTKEGHLLIREPIVSMGDWRKPRKGLTKRERGIPINIFRKIIKENKLNILSEEKILFPLLIRLNLWEHSGGNSMILVWLDAVLSKLFSWNNKYHAKNFFQKLRPQSVFYILQKRK
ncbi:MAG: methyltransferase domain-containing protein [Nanoarchaeota archaeon]|nr:methyltransferase domain-containing protein [Nanoarchaeota archaeon]